MIISLEAKEQAAREIRTLGDAGNYTGQAQAFVRATDSKIEAQYIGMKAGHFGPSDDIRDCWKIRITRAARAYTFDYGASVAGTEKRLEVLAGTGRDSTGAHYRRGVRPLPGFALTRARNWEKEAREWQPIAKITHGPTAYDVLASIEKHEPEADIDAFAAEFGYDKPSEALRVHAAVLKAWGEVRALYGEDELDLLREIN